MFIFNISSIFKIYFIPVFLSLCAMKDFQMCREGVRQKISCCIKDLSCATCYVPYSLLSPYKRFQRTFPPLSPPIGCGLYFTPWVFLQFREEAFAFSTLVGICFGWTPCLFFLLWVFGREVRSACGVQVRVAVKKRSRLDFHFSEFMKMQKIEVKENNGRMFKILCFTKGR